MFVVWILQFNSNICMAVRIVYYTYVHEYYISKTRMKIISIFGDDSNFCGIVLLMTSFVAFTKK